MPKREPWTEPLSIRERLIMRRDRARYGFDEWRRYYLWAIVARRLPKRLIYASTIQAYCRAGQLNPQLEPDALTFSQVVKPLEPRR